MTWTTTMTEEERLDALLTLAGRVFDEQDALITKLHGKYAADHADYGWNRDLDDEEGTVWIATRVYLTEGPMVLESTAQTDDGFVTVHEWRRYDTTHLTPFVATDAESV